jgi:hypothetical protein
MFKFKFSSQTKKFFRQHPQEYRNDVSEYMKQAPWKPYQEWPLEQQRIIRESLETSYEPEATTLYKERVWAKIGNKIHVSVTKKQLKKKQ